MTLNATYNAAVSSMAWTATEAGVNNLIIESPALTFPQAGTYTVSVTATSTEGSTVTATRNITVQEAPAPDASFTMTALDEVPAGERITFHASNPQMGYTYQWSMPGADKTKASASSVATSYQRQGTYKVTLTVTAPNGALASKTETIKVVEVAPIAAFSISPAVVLKGELITLHDESLYTPLTRKWLLSGGGSKYIVYADTTTLAIDEPGVYSVTLDVTNNSGSSSLTRERALIVTNADSKNGLQFSNASVVTAKKSPFSAGQAAWSIDWWMNSQWPADNINGIGDSEETMIVKTMGGGKMQLFVNGKNIISADSYVISGEWHHYAVTFADSKATFYRDGKLISSHSLSATMPELKKFCIGGSGTPFKGGIDEFRVWNTALNEEQLRAYANEPIADVEKAVSDHKLALYYNFNQSGGDVQDVTSSANHGVRTNFGPDGDAWALSKGVFCLSFGQDGEKDVTSNYLTNYAKAFANDGTCINPNLPTRTFALTGWTLENTISAGGIITGAHVDVQKNRSLTITTGWDGFASTLTDHKVFQILTLPAGLYTFTVEYDATYEGQCGNSYLVVAKGSTLPVTDNLDEAIASVAMREKNVATSNSLTFTLSEETTVSIGLLVNMSGNLCMTMQRFTLTQSQVKVIGTTEEIPAGIDFITVDKSPIAPQGIYDLMGRKVRANSQYTDGLAPGIYIIDGRKTMVR